MSRAHTAPQTDDVDEEIQYVGESLLDFVEGADREDLSGIAATFEELAEAYQEDPEAAAADPGYSQVAEHVARLWEHVEEIPTRHFVRLLVDAADHCRMNSESEANR